jgi:anti-anti-sigma factor
MLKIAKEEKQYRVELFQVNKLNTLFSDLVRQQLIGLVEQPGISVIFNLEGIRFIDSAGFGVLMEVSALAREAGSELLLCNITDDVRELINLMELENRFTFSTCEHSREKILPVLD